MNTTIDAVAAEVAPTIGAAPSRPRMLLHGLDTVQLCYYLGQTGAGGIDAEKLLAEREAMRHAGIDEGRPILLGNREFLLSPSGSRSGYPFVLNDADFRVEYGPHNKPPFFVTFRSEALWRDTAAGLHRAFLHWAESVGYAVFKPETLTRVDLCFDYALDALDFDEDCFVSLSSKDSQHREGGQIQTFTFGRSDIVLRVYDKVAEIQQQSGKVWLFALWGQNENVWRIEWQVRKAVLRRFGISSLQDLLDHPQPLLVHLAGVHDTLRVPTADSNHSRWPLHPLWIDLQQQIGRMQNLGTGQPVDRPMVLAYRKAQLAIAMQGYLKLLAAIHAVQTAKPMVEQDEALSVFKAELFKLHDPLGWKLDVSRRMKQIELGQW